MALQIKLTAKEISDRGKAIYQERLRKQVESGNVGRYLALDINSGEFEIGDEHMETVDRLRTRMPDAEIFTSLIGYPAIGAIGNRLLPNKDVA